MKFPKSAVYIICIAIPLFYFYLIIKNSVNIPIGDDLFCLLLFTQNFQDSANFFDRIKLLTEQWVEHRIVYSRFTALLSYWLTGQVNFVTIIIIGNLALIGFTILFWKLIKKTGVSLKYLIPIVLILFSPVMYEGNVWAGASTVYMPVCLLGLVTIYLLVNRNSRTGFVFASLTAILCTFSFGNGMFAFATGIFILIYQKRHKQTVIWSALTFLCSITYFYNFKKFSSTDAFGIDSHFEKPAYLFYNFFGFVGGIYDHMENINSPFVKENIPGILAGIIFTSIIAIWLWNILVKSNKNQNLQVVTWLGMTLFIGITALAMAYSRTAGEAMNTLSSRYKIYSMVIFVLVYWGGLLFTKNKKMVGIGFGIISLNLLIFQYYTHYQKLANYKATMFAGLFNYNNTNQWIIYRHTSFYEGASVMICDSIKNNPNPVHTFNSVFPQLTLEALKNASVLKNVQIKESINCQDRDGKCISIYSDSYPENPNDFQGSYLAIYDDKEIFLLPGNPRRNGKIKMLTTGQFFTNGFSLEENLGKFLKDNTTYKLAIFSPTETENIKLLDYTITNKHGESISKL